jgi:hypothetical protein
MRLAIKGGQISWKMYRWIVSFMKPENFVRAGFKKDSSIVYAMRRTPRLLLAAVLHDAIRIAG